MVLDMVPPWQRQIAAASCVAVIEGMVAQSVPARLPRRKATALAGEAAGPEKRLFLGGRGTAEDRIAMREAAEPPDDVGVQLGPAQQVGVAECAHERNAALLVG